MAADLNLLKKPYRLSRSPSSTRTCREADGAALGAIGAADYYFAIDWEQVFELWPVALLALGGWLIWGAIRDRMKAALEETSNP